MLGALIEIGDNPACRTLAKGRNERVNQCGTSGNQQTGRKLQREDKVLSVGFINTLGVI